MPTADIINSSMLHFLLFHFVNHHHSPPQVLSDHTVTRKYKGQGHGAHEVIPGTQKRRTPLDMESNSTGEIWISRGSQNNVPITVRTPASLSAVNAQTEWPKPRSLSHLLSIYPG